MLALVCAALLFLILLIQGRISFLQQLLSDRAEVVEKSTEEEKPKPMPYSTKLRIAITTADGVLLRQEVSLYGDSGMRVINGEKEEIYEAGESYVLSKPIEHTVRVEATGDGCLHISDKPNGYEGALELMPASGKTAIVNEIPLESYLKKVVPSEMPYTYGAEALKAQSVCARTYAYAHSNTYAFPEILAHMDDTVSFQVYNNCEETEETNRAILDTAGEILMHKDKVLEALYYSTSCGYTQDGSIFGENLDTGVFTSHYVGTNEKKLPIEQYVRQPDENAYEGKERYFRWQAKIAKPDTETLRAALLRQDKENITIADEKLKKALRDEKKKAKKALGSLKNVTIKERNDGGAAMSMALEFSKGNICVNGELHIREVLGSITDEITLQNGETLSQVTMLPSAAISVETTADGGFLIYGGGFGHGVGMSQNGAKTLAAIGYSYRDILQYFYKNVSLVTTE